MAGLRQGGAPIARRKAAAARSDYWRFCLDHVREYNQSYNFFAGMSDDDVARYQKDALTGHRPTWKMGTGRAATRPVLMRRSSDPLRIVPTSSAGIGAAHGRRAGAARPRIDPQCRAQGARRARPRSRAPRARSRSRFKELVKRHHPDANGGDRSTEDRLVEIIQAYNYLNRSDFADPRRSTAVATAAPPFQRRLPQPILLK